jgi:hypothetical protein
MRRYHPEQLHGVIWFYEKFLPTSIEILVLWPTALWCVLGIIG